MKTRVKEILIDIAIVVAIVVVFSIFIKPILVDGESMEPTLKDRDYLFLSRQAYHVGEPQRGQVVVFPVDEGGAKPVLFIKRVIGIPGDTIEIKGGEVYVNGEKQDQSYTKDGTTELGIEKETVPEGKLFVMGDNRNNSMDSRVIGCVDIKEVTGVAILRLWPLNKFGIVKKES